MEPIKFVEQSLDQCIKCNICTTACPVSAVTDLFPGPKYNAPQGSRFRQPGQPSPDRSVDYCSGCRVCNMVCPTGVKIAEMNARARAVLVQQGRQPLIRRLRNNILARSELVGKLGSPISPLANWGLQQGLVRRLMELVIGIHHKAPFPTFSREKFTTWFRKSDRHTNPDLQAAFFHGCSTQYYEPRIGRAAVRTLESFGFQIHIPPQNCCGLPLLSNGEFKAARGYHQNNVHKLAPYARKGIPIIGTSTSCTLTLKEEALELLDMHDEDTLLVAKATYDFNEFILTHLQANPLPVPLRPIPLTLGYHIPCQYRGHRIGKPGLELLDLIPELKLVESRQACCGVAGTYGFKKEKYEIAMQVGQPVFDFAAATSPKLVVCDSETCRWQITQATGIPAIHPVELFAYALGFDAEGALKNVLEAIHD